MEALVIASVAAVTFGLFVLGAWLDSRRPPEDLWIELSIDTTAFVAAMVAFQKSAEQAAASIKRFEEAFKPADGDTQ